MSSIVKAKKSLQQAHLKRLQVTLCHRDTRKHHRTRPGPHGCVLIRGPTLHYRNLFQIDAAQLAMVAFPMLIERKESETHPAQVAALGKGQHITARARIWEGEIEVQAVAIL